MGTPVDKKKLLDRIYDMGYSDWMEFDEDDVLFANNKFGYTCKYCGNKGSHSVKSLTKSVKKCVVCEKERMRNDFIAKSRSKFGDKYEYPKYEYKPLRSSITILCPDHGEQSMSGYYHLDRGCRLCHEDVMDDRNDIKNKEQQELKLKAYEKKHGGKYDYSKFAYKGIDVKSEIICPEHGSFFQTPKSHLTADCPKCALNNSKLGREHHVEKWISYHGDKYDYSLVSDEVKSIDDVEIICPEHGVFKQNCYTHTKHGCPKCAVETGRLSISEMEERLSESPSAKLLSYDLTTATSTKGLITVNCPKHGENDVVLGTFLSDGRCPKCSISNGQLSVEQFLDEMGTTYISNNRKLLGGLEVDILIEDHKLCIEYNGTYYHSQTTGGKHRNYHVNKLEMAFGLGYNMIQIKDVDWFHKRSIVKSIIKNRMCISKNKVYARNTEARELGVSEYRDFCNNNHIQGYTASSIKLGLFNNENLISVMSFGKPRYMKDGEGRENSYELIRLCNKLGYVVVGGASKLFKYFLKTYDPDFVKSYCDVSYFSGEIYTKLGFDKSYRSKPNYKYFKIRGFSHKKHGLESRIKYQKAKLTKIFGADNVDMSKSEYEIMLDNKFDRIWDCGNDVYIWKK